MVNKNNAILYSTGCPRCKVLKKKLDDAGVEYETVGDVEEMTRLGFDTAPMLVVGGEVMNFTQAVKWVSDWERR